MDLLCVLFSVAECKVLYKSIRDALRYRQKKIGGKSGDSGGELENDEAINDDWEFKDSLAFLTPTTSRHPRQTITLGAGNDHSKDPTDPKQKPYNPLLEDSDNIAFEFDEATESSVSSVYSYVSMLFNILFNI